MIYIIISIVSFIIGFVVMQEGRLEIMIGLLFGFLCSLGSILVTVLFALIISLNFAYEEVRTIPYKDIAITENIAVITFDFDGEKVVKSFDTNSVPVSIGEEASIVSSYVNIPDNLFNRMFLLYNDDITDKYIIEEDYNIDKIVVDEWTAK